jgi:hypothetical protein
MLCPILTLHAYGRQTVKQKLALSLKESLMIDLLSILMYLIYFKVHGSGR